MRESFFQYFAEVFRLGDAPTLHTEGSGDGSVIGGIEVNREIALVVT